jgi:hypothetical protein
VSSQASLFAKDALQREVTEGAISTSVVCERIAAAAACPDARRQGEDELDAWNDSVRLDDGSHRRHAPVDLGAERFEEIGAVAGARAARLAARQPEDDACFLELARGLRP